MRDSCERRTQRKLRQRLLLLGHVGLIAARDDQNRDVELRELAVLMSLGDGLSFDIRGERKCELCTFYVPLCQSLFTRIPNRVEKDDARCAANVVASGLVSGSNDDDLALADGQLGEVGDDFSLQRSDVVARNAVNDADKGERLGEVPEVGSLGGHSQVGNNDFVLGMTSDLRVSSGSAGNYKQAGQSRQTSVTCHSSFADLKDSRVILDQVERTASSTLCAWSSSRATSRRKVLEMWKKLEAEMFAMRSRRCSFLLEWKMELGCRAAELPCSIDAQKYKVQVVDTAVTSSTNTLTVKSVQRP